MISLSLDIHTLWSALVGLAALCHLYLCTLHSLSLLSLTIITLESGLWSKPKNDSVLLLPAKP